jgi:hypothetical protein
MNGTRAKVMDISSGHRTSVSATVNHQQRSTPPVRWILGAIGALVLIAAIIVGIIWYQHRHDQVLLGDRYQIVYLLTGQIYIGKLQNTRGQYLTLTHAYTLQAPQADAAKTDTTSNLVQVSRQVYGPEDSMALRADQVAFWQNLRTDSKVVKAIESSPAQ